MYQSNRNFSYHILINKSLDKTQNTLLCSYFPSPETFIHNPFAHLSEILLFLILELGYIFYKLSALDKKRL